MADALFPDPAPDAPMPGEPYLYRMMIPTAENKATVESSRSAFNAGERLSLMKEIGAAQQLDTKHLGITNVNKSDRKSTPRVPR